MQALRAGKTIDYTCTAAVAADDVLVIGDIVGIACTNGAVGDVIAADVSGVFPLACAVAITQGKTVYWDTTAKTVVAAEASGAVKLGHAWETVTADAGSVAVKIND